MKRLEDERLRGVRLGSEIPSPDPKEPQYSMRNVLNNRLDQGKPCKNF